MCTTVWYNVAVQCRKCCKVVKIRLYYVIRNKILYGSSLGWRILFISILFAAERPVRYFQMSCAYHLVAIQRRNTLISRLEKPKSKINLCEPLKTQRRKTKDFFLVI